MAKKSISPEFCRWLADVKMAIEWTSLGDDWGKVLKTGMKAGSKDKMPNADYYDALILVAEKQKQQVIRLGEVRKKADAKKNKMFRRWVSKYHPIWTTMNWKALWFVKRARLKKTIDSLIKK